MRLRDLFTSVAIKQLVAVDLPHGSSHQHELNGTKALRDFFQTSNTIKGSIQWMFFADDQDTLRRTTGFTFYDARANQTHRSAEWRMYYDTGADDLLVRANSGDILILCRPAQDSQRDQIYALVIQAGSRWLAGLEAVVGDEARSANSNLETLSPEVIDQQLQFVGERVVEELGLELPSTVIPSDEELVNRQFPGEGVSRFPITSVMSAFAREQSPFDGTDPDESLIAWLQREEQLFRALERQIVQTQLDRGFADVDEFVSYSLTVQNRRKSRMGYALQNHLMHLFRIHNLRFDAQGKTEGRSTPDFLFPGSRDYHDALFPNNKLAMLGAKSTCKDRWRQILAEADRIPTKHLCTLEPGISATQTDEMKTRNVVLVLPTQLLKTTYTAKQQENMIDVSQFIDVISMMQKP